MATALGHRDKPFPGCFSVCLNCGTILKFLHDMSYKIATTEELHTNLSPVLLARVQLARARIVARGPISPVHDTAPDPSIFDGICSDLPGVWAMPIFRPRHAM
jgi:hypothetical protein